MTDHEKILANRLDHIILQHIKVAKKITKAFGFKSETMVSNFKNTNHTATICQLHMDGLEKYFDIPLSIWEDTPLSYEEIDQKIIEYKKHKQNSIESSKTNLFEPNEKVFEKLKGKWYGYMYASNPPSAKEGIWLIETTIYDDYSVEDYWGNRGYLQIGKNQSIIFKQPYENDDLTIIRFSNRHISFQHFRFVAISNQNNTLDEMINFGFFSRKKYTEKEAKEILGEQKDVQMKLNMKFAQRLNAKAVVPQYSN